MKPLKKLTRFLQKKEKVDKQIKAIINVTKSSDLQLIFKQIIRSHGKLVRGYAGEKGNSARSFWSKYLHFHTPIVPLYDSKASKNITKIFRDYGFLDKSEFRELLKVHGDDPYKKYVQRFIILATALFDSKERLIKKKIKEIDYFLLTYTA